ncbi:UNVERIFIED_CONTAM: hypothetical protein Scaly_1110200 [Sesamum calycinum]|uniref:FBD domain-containing protein n=1 Tax=Sesamum calycinum TaxID=2727403 RepID=A0AAW2QM30_9LAMI
MSLPPAFKGFSRLLRLDLNSVLIAPAELKKLISKCPMLEYVDLHNLDREAEKLEIDASNLKYFSFFGSFNLICFKNASRLTKMSMTCFIDEKLDYDMFEDYAIFDPYESDSNLIEVLGQLSYLKSNGRFLKFLARGGVSWKLPTNLSHLTDLCLSSFRFQCIAQVMCALCLIRSSPNLQSLEIIICRFSGLEPEMEFVKHLLSAATALRKLEIGSNYAAKTGKGSKMLKELVSFCRASPKAQIIFQDPPCQ